MDTKAKDFKKLQREWDAKLKASGFEDIEQRHDGNLKTWASARVFKEKRNGEYYENKAVYYQSVEEYYRLAGQFLHTYKFDSDKERLIWEKHADGMSMNEITAYMKKRRFKVYRCLVQNVIQKLAKEMKEGSWNVE